MKRVNVFWVVLTAILALAAVLPPIFAGGQAQPIDHLSVRGQMVVLFGQGPYRHMPTFVAVQGLAQDWVTLLVALPALLLALAGALRGSRAAYLALCGIVAYFTVQYFMYLGMGTYNELFLVWAALLLSASQALFRLLLAPGADVYEQAPVPGPARRYVGGFLLVNGSLIALLWLGVLLPPLLDGTVYPDGLAHFTTMVVQGYDLALFLPASLVVGWAYLMHRSPGGLLAPVYCVFLSLQMLALLAKILWMQSIGVSAGPALVIIPLLLAGAMVAAVLALKPHRAGDRTQMV